SYRNGFVLGEGTRQLERFLAYNGARLNGRPTAGKSGEYCFDEYLIESSKCDFDLLFPHELDKESDQCRLVNQGTSRLTPELELSCHSSSDKPLLRIAVLQLPYEKRGSELPL